MNEAVIHSLFKVGNYESAMSLLEDWPASPEKVFYMSTCFLNKKNPDYVQAERGFRALLRSSCDSALERILRLRLSISLHGQNRLIDAIQELLPLLKDDLSQKCNQDAFLNCGNLYLELGMADHWLRLIDRLSFPVTSNAKDIKEAQYLYQRGLSHLFAGELSEGWKYCEYRFKAGCAELPTFGLPRLENLTRKVGGRRILLYGDQGLGDILFAFRFVPAFRKIFNSIYLMCPKSLQSFSLASGLFDGTLIADELDRLDEQMFDFWAPLSSLPYFLDVSSASHFSFDPIKISDRHIPQWCESLQVAKCKRPLVALNWQGGCEKESLFSAGIRERSFPFFEYETVAALRQCSLISVQVGSAAEQVWDSPLSEMLLSQQSNFDQEPNDFLLTASVLTTVDLLITNDTSVAHLGGVLGVPTWVVLKCHPYWQWGDTSEFNSWYPSVRCFRQKKPFEWGGAMENLDAALREHLLASVQTKFTPPVLNL